MQIPSTDEGESFSVQSRLNPDIGDRYDIWVDPNASI